MICIFSNCRSRFGFLPPPCTDHLHVPCPFPEQFWASRHNQSKHKFILCDTLITLKMSDNSLDKDRLYCRHNYTSYITEADTVKTPSKNISFARALMEDIPSVSSHSSNNNTSDRPGARPRFKAGSAPYSHTLPYKSKFSQKSPSAASHGAVRPSSFGEYTENKRTIEAKHEQIIKSKSSVAKKQRLEDEMQRPEVLALVKKYHPGGGSAVDLDNLGFSPQDESADVDEPMEVEDGPDENIRRKHYRQKVANHYRRIVQEQILTPESEYLSESWNSSMQGDSSFRDSESPTYRTGIDDSQWQEIDHRRSMSLERDKSLPRRASSSGDSDDGKRPVPSPCRERKPRISCLRKSSTPKKQKRVRVRRHDSVIHCDSEPGGYTVTDLESPERGTDSEPERTVMPPAEIHDVSDSPQNNHTDSDSELFSIEGTDLENSGTYHVHCSDSFSEAQDNVDFPSDGSEFRKPLYQGKKTTWDDNDNSSTRSEPDLDVLKRAIPRAGSPLSDMGTPHRKYRVCSRLERDDSQGMTSESSERSSRLDPQTYQSYAAGILNSSRKSEAYLLLQKHYCTLERIHEIELETQAINKLLGRDHFNRLDVRARSMGSLAPQSLADAMLLSKYKLDSLWELKELYAELDEAQEKNQFLWDCSKLDDIQWNPWKDFGLRSKHLSIQNIQQLYESGENLNTKTKSKRQHSLQKFKREQSFDSLQKRYQHLDERSRKERITKELFGSGSIQSKHRRNSSSSSAFSQSSHTGSYLDMMQSATKNASDRAIYGYHIRERGNGYDQYIQKLKSLSKSCPDLKSMETNSKCSFRSSVSSCTTDGPSPSVSAHDSSRPESELDSTPSTPTRKSSLAHRALLRGKPAMNKSSWKDVKPPPWRLRTERLSPGESGYESHDNRRWKSLKPNGSLASETRSMSQVESPTENSKGKWTREIRGVLGHNEHSQKMSDTKVSKSAQRPQKNGVVSYIDGDAKNKANTDDELIGSRDGESRNNQDVKLELLTMHEKPNRLDNFRKKHNWRKDSKPDPGTVSNALALFQNIEKTSKKAVFPQKTHSFHNLYNIRETSLPRDAVTQREPGRTPAIGGHSSSHNSLSAKRTDTKSYLLTDKAEIIVKNKTDMSRSRLKEDKQDEVDNTTSREHGIISAVTVKYDPSTGKTKPSDNCHLVKQGPTYVKANQAQVRQLRSTVEPLKTNVNDAVVQRSEHRDVLPAARPRISYVEDVRAVDAGGKMEDVSSTARVSPFRPAPTKSIMQSKNKHSSQKANITSLPKAVHMDHKQWPGDDAEAAIPRYGHQRTDEEKVTQDVEPNRATHLRLDEERDSSSNLTERTLQKWPADFRLSSTNSNGSNDTMIIHSSNETLIIHDDDSDTSVFGAGNQQRGQGIERSNSDTNLYSNPPMSAPLSVREVKSEEDILHEGTAFVTLQEQYGKDQQREYPTRGLSRTISGELKEIRKSYGREDKFRAEEWEKHQPQTPTSPTTRVWRRETPGYKQGSPSKERDPDKASGPKPASQQPWRIVRSETQEFGPKEMINDLTTIENEWQKDRQKKASQKSPEHVNHDASFTNGAFQSGTAKSQHQITSGRRDVPRSPVFKEVDTLKRSHLKQRQPNSFTRSASADTSLNTLTVAQKITGRATDTIWSHHHKQRPIQPNPSHTRPYSETTTANKTTIPPTKVSKTFKQSHNNTKPPLAPADLKPNMRAVGKSHEAISGPNARKPHTTSQPALAPTNRMPHGSSG